MYILNCDHDLVSNGFWLLVLGIWHWACQSPNRLRLSILIFSSCDRDKTLKASVFFLTRGSLDLIFMIHCTLIFWFTPQSTIKGISKGMGSIVTVFPFLPMWADIRFKRLGDPGPGSRLIPVIFWEPHPKPHNAPWTTTGLPSPMMVSPYWWI